MLSSSLPPLNLSLLKLQKSIIGLNSKTKSGTHHTYSPLFFYFFFWVSKLSNIWVCSNIEVVDKEQALEIVETADIPAHESDSEI